MIKKFHPSLHAPGEPGRQNINVPLATPAKALDCRVEVLMFWYERLLNISPNPSIVLSSRGRMASGVPSFPVIPVPPVVMIP